MPVVVAMRSFTAGTTRRPAQPLNGVRPAERDTVLRENRQALVVGGPPPTTVKNPYAPAPALVNKVAFFVRP